jgi:hypothetical protein
VSAHKLGVCEGCFDGRKTWWMDLAGRYFDDHVDHCKVTKESVATTKSRFLLRQKKAARVPWPPLFSPPGVWLTLLRPPG